MGKSISSAPIDWGTFLRYGIRTVATFAYFSTLTLQWKEFSVPLARRAILHGCYRNELLDCWADVFTVRLCLTEDLKTSIPFEIARECLLPLPDSAPDVQYADARGILGTNGPTFYPPPTPPLFLPCILCEVVRRPRAGKASIRCIKKTYSVVEFYPAVPGAVMPFDLRASTEAWPFLMRAYTGRIPHRTDAQIILRRTLQATERNDILRPYMRVLRANDLQEVTNAILRLKGQVHVV